MPPILESDRIRLRLPRSNDLDNIFRLGSNPRVMQFITPGKVQSRSEARIDLQKRIATACDDLGYWVAEVRQTGEFLGWMALKQMEDKKEVEMGYRFLEEYWGKGYATEGGRKILEYAFRTLYLERVAAVALEENRASTRVMEKLGMRFSHRGYYYHTHCVCYEISRQEYLAGLQTS